ncbi:MAG: alpha-ketoacid dehydrogenase subunit beta, partial [Deltaproteobacteria bacterium]|nr:alpha-ketoacid dehydrogenase subunit beta [Deltaproteobacteria bacterium]
MRELRYREAIDEATRQAMAKDDRIFVMGVGVDDPKGIFGTTRGAFQQFGSHRVFDTPLSEAALTGIAIGAALGGFHPLLVHARNDFMLLTMDQLVNNGAKWRYMSGGKLRVPLTIRAIIGRGWGQAAQHSQSLQAMFAHVPGLQVVMPATPADAKGLLMAALSAEAPVICLEHRWLYEKTGPVLEEPYSIPLGRGIIVRQGSDVTVAAVSYMVWESIQAAEVVAGEGIQAEVVDLRSVRPLDSALVGRSVAKTGRLVIADTAWRSFGLSAELAACIGEVCFSDLKAPIRRVALPDVPTPCSSALERIYYPGPNEIVAG